MERRDIDQELARTDARELLSSVQLARLGYAGSDGTPRVVPVAYFWTGVEFVVATATTAPKVAALTAHPAVALTIDAGDTPEQARSLSIRGRADVEIVDGVVEEYLAAASRVMAADVAAEFEQNCRQLYDRMARVAITPTWARYYDFGAGRLPGFLRDLVQKSLS